MNHAQVTMRMETPVLYFYPPATTNLPLQADVCVSFHGGWISEYYPAAEVDAPGLEKMALTPDVVGELAWNDVLIGADGALPETDDPVWLTPRLEGPARVVTSEGEAEDYLFYRGVGNFSGPLRVMTDRQQNRLQIEVRENQDAEHFDAIWLIEVRPDLTVAFRRVPKQDASHDSPVLAQTERGFDDHKFSEVNRTRLHRDMHKELCRAGLFPNEATAMLQTWEQAYFKSPGLRVFYVVPRAWTDERLPLSVSLARQSIPVVVERVMMGRIELVSDRQRQLIDQLKKKPSGDSKWTQEIPPSPERDKFYRGQSDFGDLGIEIPRYYQDYLDIGRFRNALLRYELQNSPTDELKEFAVNHGLVTKSLK